jgi:hypothetical protein
LHRLNLNAPIAIEWRPLRCRASRPEPNTLDAVYIVEDGCCGRSGCADLAVAAGSGAGTHAGVVPLD